MTEEENNRPLAEEWFSFKFDIDILGQSWVNREGFFFGRDEFDKSKRYLLNLDFLDSDIKEKLNLVNKENDADGFIKLRDSIKNEYITKYGDSSGEMKYNEFIFNLELKTLEDVAVRCENFGQHKYGYFHDPVIEDSSRLLMIKALRKVSRKLLNSKKVKPTDVQTGRIKEILKKHDVLRIEYLKTHPGVNALQLYTDINPRKVDNIQKIIDNKNAQLRGIAKAKLFEPVRGTLDNIPKLDMNGRNISSCVNRANLIKNNPRVLKTFLEENVFDVVLDNRYTITENMMEDLNELVTLYLTTIPKKTPTDKHKGNVAKLFFKANSNLGGPNYNDWEKELLLNEYNKVKCHTKYNYFPDQKNKLPYELALQYHYYPNLNKNEDLSNEIRQPNNDKIKNLQQLYLAYSYVGANGELEKDKPSILEVKREQVNNPRTQEFSHYQYSISYNFRTNKDPEPSYWELQPPKESISDKVMPQAELVKNNIVPENRNSIKLDYNKQQIINAPRNKTGENNIQLSLLLDWFENLPQKKQNSWDNLLFFEKVIVLNLEDSANQLRNYPQVKERWQKFFEQEFNKLQVNLDRIENLNDNINRYLILQRIATVLKGEKIGDIKNLQNSLKTSHERCYNLLTSKEYNDLSLDKGKIASYALANMAEDEDFTKNENKAEQATTFSVYSEIYGLGKDSEKKDPHLIDHIGHAQLKIANYWIGKEEDDTLKQKLINILKNTGLEDLQNIPESYDWFPSNNSGCFFVNINNNNKIIEINIFTGQVFINNKQVTKTNVPDKIKDNEKYKAVFGDAAIVVTTQGADYISTENNLKDLKITENTDNSIDIYWTDQKTGKQYVLLDKTTRFSGLPDNVNQDNFNFWSSVGEGGEPHILVSPKDATKSPAPLLKIKKDDTVVKYSNEQIKLYNSAIEVSNLGFSRKNQILTWKDETNKKYTIEIPLTDSKENPLVFEKKEREENWTWTEDPSFYIAPSDEQNLSQRSSINKFILLKNKDGKQKLILPNVKKNDSSEEKVKYLVFDVDVNKNSGDNKGTEKAKLSSSDPLANLRLAYWYVVSEEENEKYLATELLQQKLQVARPYTDEEIKVLREIIESNPLSISADATVAKLYAAYLLEKNIQFYNKDKKTSSPYRDVVQGFKTLKTVKSFATARGELSNFVPDLQELKDLFPQLQKEFSDLLPSTKSEFKKVCGKKCLDNINVNDDKDLPELEQEILQKLNHKWSQSNTDKIKQQAGINRTLTMDDAISLLLKQDLNLWKYLTDITEGTFNYTQLINLQQKIIYWLQRKIKEKHGVTALEHQYNPIEHPEFLIYEYAAGIILRDDQVKALKILFEETDDINDEIDLKENFIKLPMGMGKSKVLNPILAHRKADGKKLSILVLTDPLHTSGTQDLEQSLQLLGTRVQVIKFSRNDCNEEYLDQLFKKLEEAKTKGIACTATMRDLQTLKSMVWVRLEDIQKAKDSSSGNEYIEKLEAQFKKLVEINNLIKKDGLFTLDELDSQLDTKHQLNLPIGDPISVPKFGTEAVSNLIQKLLTIQDAKEKIITNEQSLLGEEDFKKTTIPKLIENLFPGLLKESANFHYVQGKVTEDDGSPTLDAVFAYDGFNDTINNSEDPAEKNRAKEAAIYRALLADNMLINALHKKSNEHFGRSQQNSDLEIVIPYASANTPKEASLFKSPWETVVKTFIYYSSTEWKDVKQSENFAKFLHMKLLEIQNEEEKDEIKELLGDLLDKNNNNLNLKDSEKIKQFTKKIEEKRKQGNVKLIFKYLTEKVFPEQIKFFTYQAVNTPKDFVSQADRVQGYSGTDSGAGTWSRVKYDKSIENNQEKTIIDHLNDKKKPKIITIKAVSNENLKDKLKKLEAKQYDSLIDSGALLKEYSNDDIAETLFEVLPKSKTAIAYYRTTASGEKNLVIRHKDPKKPLSFIKGSSKEEIARAIGCDVNDFLGENTPLFNFYDQAHLIGTDLPNPSKGKAIITYNEHLTKDLMMQSIMRMRQFENGEQKVDFAINEKVATSIKTEGELIVTDLITHAEKIQKTKEKYYNYSALHQEIDHTIRDYFDTLIAREVNKGVNMDTILALYKEVKQFVLAQEGDDIWKQFGYPTGTKNPWIALIDKLKSLEVKIRQVIKSLPAYSREIDKILTKIIELKTTYEQEKEKENNKIELPLSVSANNQGDSSGEEVEQQAEAEEEAEEEVEQQVDIDEKYRSENLEIVENNPRLGDDLDFEFQENDQASSILSPHLTKISSPYYPIIMNKEVYYSTDMKNVFKKFLPQDTITKPIEKPIIYNLLVKEDGKFRIMILSAEESAKFAETINANISENPTREVFLMNTKGDLITKNSSSTVFKNPFTNKDFDLKNNKELFELLLTTLVLQRNIDYLTNIVDNFTKDKNKDDFKPLTMEFISWFNNNKKDLSLIFNKKATGKKFSRLSQKVSEAQDKLTHVQPLSMAALVAQDITTITISADEQIRKILSQKIKGTGDLEQWVKIERLLFLIEEKKKRKLTNKELEELTLKNDAKNDVKTLELFWNVFATKLQQQLGDYINDDLRTKAAGALAQKYVAAKLKDNLKGLTTKKMENWKISSTTNEEDKNNRFTFLTTSYNEEKNEEERLTSAMIEKIKTELTTAINDQVNEEIAKKKKKMHGEAIKKFFYKIHNDPKLVQSWAKNENFKTNEPKLLQFFEAIKNLVKTDNGKTKLPQITGNTIKLNDIDVQLSDDEKSLFTDEDFVMMLAEKVKPSKEKYNSSSDAEKVEDWRSAAIMEAETKHEKFLTSLNTFRGNINKVIKDFKNATTLSDIEYLERKGWFHSTEYYYSLKHKYMLEYKHQYPGYEEKFEEAFGKLEALVKDKKDKISSNNSLLQKAGSDGIEAAKAKILEIQNDTTKKSFEKFIDVFKAKLPGDEYSKTLGKEEKIEYSNKYQETINKQLKQWNSTDGFELSTFAKEAAAMYNLPDKLGDMKNLMLTGFNYEDNSLLPSYNYDSVAITNLAKQLLFAEDETEEVKKLINSMKEVNTGFVAKFHENLKERLQDKMNKEELDVLLGRIQDYFSEKSEKSEKGEGNKCPNITKNNMFGYAGKIYVESLAEIKDTSSTAYFDSLVNSLVNDNIVINAFLRKINNGYSYNLTKDIISKKDTDKTAFLLGYKMVINSKIEEALEAQKNSITKLIEKEDITLAILDSAVKLLNVLEKNNKNTNIPQEVTKVENEFFTSTINQIPEKIQKSAANDVENLKPNNLDELLNLINRLSINSNTNDKGFPEHLSEHKDAYNKAYKAKLTETIPVWTENILKKQETIKTMADAIFEQNRSAEFTKKYLQRRIEEKWKITAEIDKHEKFYDGLITALNKLKPAEPKPEPMKPAEPKPEPTPQQVKIRKRPEPKISILDKNERPRIELTKAIKELEDAKSNELDDKYYKARGKLLTYISGLDGTNSVTEENEYNIKIRKAHETAYNNAQKSNKANNENAFKDFLTKAVKDNSIYNYEGQTLKKYIITNYKNADFKEVIRKIREVKSFPIRGKTNPSLPERLARMEVLYNRSNDKENKARAKVIHDILEDAAAKKQSNP